MCPVVAQLWLLFSPHIILRLWQSLQTPTWILPSRSEKQQHMLPCVFSWCLPHLANKLNPDLIFLTRSGVHLWEMLTIKPESLPLCSTGMTRIKFCNILTIWICSLSSYGKENVALGACAFFQLEVKSKTKGHLKQTERLADTQPTQSRNQGLWEVDVFVVLMMKIVFWFCLLFYNSLRFDITHSFVCCSFPDGNMILLWHAKLSDNKRHPQQ